MRLSQGFFGKQALSVCRRYKPGPEVLQSVLLNISYSKTIKKKGCSQRNKDLEEKLL